MFDIKTRYRRRLRQQFYEPGASILKINSFFHIVENQKRLGRIHRIGPSADIRALSHEIVVRRDLFAVFS